MMPAAIGKRLIQVTGSIAGLLLLCTVFSDAAAIVFRYGIDQPLIWTEEAQRYLMVWVAFLGSAAALVSNDHMAIDLLSGLLPPWARRLRRIALLVLIAAYCGVLVWKGIPLALENAYQSAPATGIPMTYPYLAIGVGGALMLCAAVLRIMSEIAGPRLSHDAASPRLVPEIVGLRLPQDAAS
jgi:TRAP-type C4-dicarboxylate transport system permease small subunit